MKESERRKVIVMGTEFDKKIMFDNISFILKEIGKKIGELEAEAGVSAGYISRSSKDSNAKPGIDFVVNVANALGTSVDTLIRCKLSELTPTERYMVSFIDKLKKDTVLGTIEWGEDAKKEMCNIHPFGITHPLFKYKAGRVLFESKIFGENTLIRQDCFHLRLKNNTTLYLMSIKNCLDENWEEYGIEMWIHKPEQKAQFLCGGVEDTFFYFKLNDIYAAIKENLKHPKINADYKYIIDSFMENDMEDDPIEGDLPF